MLAELHAGLSYRAVGHEYGNESTVEYTPRKRQREFASEHMFTLVSREEPLQDIMTLKKR